MVGNPEKPRQLVITARLLAQTSHSLALKEDVGGWIGTVIDREGVRRDRGRKQGRAMLETMRSRTVSAVRNIWRG